MYVEFLWSVMVNGTFVVTGALMAWLVLALIRSGDVIEDIGNIIVGILGTLVAFVFGVFGVAGFVLWLMHKGFMNRWLMTIILVPYFVVWPMSWHNNEIIILGVSLLFAVLFQAALFLFFRQWHGSVIMNLTVVGDQKGKRSRTLMGVIEYVLGFIVVGSLVQTVYSTYLDYRLLQWMYSLPLMQEASLMILSRNVMVSPIYAIFENAFSNMLELMGIAAFFIVFRFRYAVITLIYSTACIGLLLTISMVV